MNSDIVKLLNDRYFLSTENSWEELAERVGKIYDPITEDIIQMNFIPSSPTLMNAHTTERKGTLSSCFPMSIDDSIEDIYKALFDGAIVTKFGGGVGYDFSILRGSSEIIKGIGGRKSSGPLPFINNFNAMLDGIMQGGVRRGAGMALLSIEHPDILSFIKAKNNLEKFNRLNFSVKIPNTFYTKLKNNPDEIHHVKNITDGEYFPLINENGNKVTVKQLWNLIIENAHRMAEPGIFNETVAYDRCTVTNVSQTVLSNPCQEFVNIPFTACALGSINLSNLIEGKTFNWEKFEKLIAKSTRFLNNTIDQNNFPIEKIKQTSEKVRPIGLGYMGLAHALYKKGIPYNSEKAFKFTEEVTHYMTLCSMKESVELAKEYCQKIYKEGNIVATSDNVKFGAYPAFDYDLFMKANERFFKHKHCRNIDVEQLKADIKKYGIRNSCFTSLAPTGTISTIAQVSSGMEPVFALTYMRKVEKLNKEYDVMYITDPVFENYLNKNFKEEEKLKILKEVSENKGSCQKCRDIPDEVKKIFVTASDLTPEEHLNILEAVANNVSLSCSKTINLPKEINKEEVSKVFLDAHRRGIIGVTVYRDECREGILVHSDSIKKDEEGRPSTITYTHAPKRPKELPCDVHRISVLGKDENGNKVTEKWIVFVGLLDKKPYEFFAGKIKDVNLPKNIEHGYTVKIKSGVYAFKYEDEILITNICKTFDNSENETFARLVSALLRQGMHPKYAIDQLHKCPGTIVDFSKATIRMLKKYIEDGTDSGICEKCGAKLKYESGCITCSDPLCGWSKCS